MALSQPSNLAPTQLRSSRRLRFRVADTVDLATDTVFWRPDTAFSAPDAVELSHSRSPAVIRLHDRSWVRVVEYDFPLKGRYRR